MWERTATHGALRALEADLETGEQATNNLDRFGQKLYSESGPIEWQRRLHVLRLHVTCPDPEFEAAIAHQVDGGRRASQQRSGMKVDIYGLGPDLGLAGPVRAEQSSD